MDMILHSTNGATAKVSLPEGVANGLSPDGGLYMPDIFPRLPQAFYNNLTDMSLQEIAYVIANTLFGDLVESSLLKKIVYDSLNFDIPLRHIGGDTFMLELFHGPTKSFKDIGARFMARLLPVIDPVDENGRDIIVATSGDSGGAIANGFSRAANTRVFVLFPKDELERYQIAQFTTERNVVAIEVNGSYDQCQAMVKEVLRTNAATLHDRRHITSGNSINLLRQFASIIYFFHGYARALAARPGQPVVISVPCGNLGNLSAGLMAKRMGLPTKRFIAANNANDVFVEYLQTGGFSPKAALMTIARAMDVGNPSNLARIIDLYGGNLEHLREDVEGVSLDDETLAVTMRHLADELDIVVEPQTAAAFAALHRKQRPGETGLVLACADPSKFAGTVERIIGHSVKMPHLQHSIRQLRDVRIVKIPPTLSALDRVMQLARRNQLAN